MRKFDLNRWQRVGIVLSVLWAIVAGSWGWRHAYDQADATFKLCVAAIPTTTLKSCREERARALVVPRGVSAALVALAPVTAFWLIVYGLVAFGRRTRRAFVPQPNLAGVAEWRPGALQPELTPTAPNPTPVSTAIQTGPVFAATEDVGMSPNKRTVKKYMDGFRRSDHQEILSCLTDDVDWLIPGLFHVKGKDAFDREIENEAFVGSPAITVTRLTEEGNIVVAEGRVRAARREGGYVDAAFCDVFEMRDGKIRRLTSYLMEVKGE